MEKFDIVLDFAPYSDKIIVKGYIQQNPKLESESKFYYLTEPKATKKAIKLSIEKRMKEAISQVKKELTEKYRDYIKLEKSKVAVNKIYRNLKAYTDKDLQIIFFGEVIEEYRFTTEENTFFHPTSDFEYGLSFKVNMYKNKVLKETFEEINYFYPVKYDKNYTIKEIEKDLIRIRTLSLKNIKIQVNKFTFNEIEASLCQKYTDPFNNHTTVIAMEEDFDEVIEATKIEESN